MKERAGKKKVVLELGGNAGVIVDKIGRPRLGGQALPRRRVRLCRPGLHQRPADVHPRGRLGRRSWTQFVAGAAALKVGDPLDPTTDLGPMVDATGRRPDPALGRRGGRDGRQGRCSAARADGTFFPPTILTDVPLTGPGLLERGVRAARRRLPVPRPRRGDRAGQRLDVRAADRRLHQRPGRRVAGVRRARGRRRHRSTTSRPTGSTTCPTAASRTPASGARACATRWTT